jgi:tRNA(Ile)-lysidine synthase
MTDLFQKYIQEHHLFPESAAVLLAVSGGIDSVVMCELFHRSGYRFAIAHCNFGLRGKESDGDEAFAERLAKKYGVDFYSRSFGTEEYAKRYKLSTQEAARELRYEWFEELRKKNNFSRIATAHHAGDSAETFFIQLLRGTGLAGLKGIPPRNGKVIRPLLFTNRAEIHRFAGENKLSWRNDASNDTDAYVRNKIRHHLIPLFEKMQPSFGKIMQKNISHFATAAEALHEWVEMKTKGSITPLKKGEFKISLPGIGKKWRTFLLFEFLKDKGFNMSDVEALCKESSRKAGRIFYAANFEALRDREDIIVRKRKKIPAVQLAITARMRSMQVADKNWKILTPPAGDAIPRNPEIACLAADKLHFPLTLRRWQDGDSFVPLGMKGKKKISDFLTDNRISLFEKENIFVILSGPDIVCILGHRIDDRFKITTRTKKIFRIEPEAI